MFALGLPVNSPQATQSSTKATRDDVSDDDDTSRSDDDGGGEAQPEDLGVYEHEAKGSSASGSSRSASRSAER